MNFKRVEAGKLGQTLVQVRFKRKLAYPDRYNPRVPQPNGRKDHSSYFQRAIKQFLGPKNIKGEYYKNKYYYPPQNNQPSYIVPDGKSVEGEEAESRRFGNSNRNPSLHPFPDNIQCKTASNISYELREKIVDDSLSLPVEKVAQKYGLKLARVEAIVRLYNIEKDWREKSKITSDLDKFSKVMYNMFPLYNPPVESENLTEIPVPKKTLHQRFVSIAESEPFGPVDAAKVFGLEPASETLAKLTHINDDAQEIQNHQHQVIVGKEKEGDRGLFKFVQAKAGEVGFRYGASRRDKKKDKAVGFDRTGRLYNLL